MDKALGEGERLLAIRRGALDDLVVDVGVVSDVGDLVAAVAEVARDDVKGHEHARMADVREVVDGHAADVEPDLARGDGFKRPLGAGHGVVQREGWQGHGVVRSLLEGHEGSPAALAAGQTRGKRDGACLGRGRERGEVRTAANAVLQPGR